MKIIFVTADDLFLSLTLSPIVNSGVTESSFAVRVNFMKEGKVKKGKLIIYGRDILNRDKFKTLLSFHGVMTTDNEEPLFLSGICSKGETYESCYLLVVEPDTFESSISKQQFIGLAKEYCQSRKITTYENGNIVGDGFPLLENLLKDSNAPAPILLERTHKGMEIYTMLHDDYFPMIYKGKTCFGKFIAENTVRVFPVEEVTLLRTRSLIV